MLVGNMGRRNRIYDWNWLFPRRPDASVRAAVCLFSRLERPFESRRLCFVPEMGIISMR
ncbi:hypothetical protein J31TS4_07930 [Paenibacillus sp. J31TS4]|nr:hypothetical protein J31TS4_07930 [Paenibacillus sp. J31TS4]